MALIIAREMLAAVWFEVVLDAEAEAVLIIKEGTRGDSRGVNIRV